MRSKLVEFNDEYFVLLPQELLDAAGLSGAVVVSSEGGRIILANDGEAAVPQGG